MPKYYTEIPGWFHAKELYDFVINNTRESALFVEIGSYFGRSGCYMAELINEKNKSVQFHMIDPWEWNSRIEYCNNQIDEGKHYYDGNTLLSNEHKRIIKELGKNPYDIMQYYFHKFNISNVTFIKNKSINVVDGYEDGSIDFLYIDGDHSYSAVKQDIATYLPKIKKGGIISGDDYASFSEVKKAVDETLHGVDFIGNSLTWWKTINY